jgi:LPS-assembly lipoprotein
MRFETIRTSYKITTAARQQGALYLASFILCIVLSGCGFHLRGASSIALPPELSTMRVTMGGASYPPLLVEMRNALLAIDSSGRISAYLLNYRVDYSLLGPDKKLLLPKQPVKLQREYGFDRLNVIATEKQSEFLQTEMRRDVVQQILRRLARVGSANTAGSNAD